VTAIGQTAMNVFIGSCEETRQHLSAHLERDLRGLRKWRVAAHLRRCDRCRAVLASLARAVEQLRQLGREQFAPPEALSFADAVVERLHGDRPAADV
jgi:predicted anti-sigma-YlaC factor YlaD